jgi:putative SOS response-associated peptidase YedK
MNEVSRAFDLEPGALAPAGGWRPRFNVAPTQEIAAIRRDAKGSDRQVAWLQWGLIPPWADVPTTGYRMINARAETVATRRAFRDAFRRRRCLVPADGFYEWKRGTNPKQPYYIRMEEDRPFAFAALWEYWRRGDVEIQSCSIITTEANALVTELHDRMPVILDPHDYDAWLEPGAEDTDRLELLLVPTRPNE